MGSKPGAARASMERQPTWPWCTTSPPSSNFRSARGRDVGNQGLDAALDLVADHPH